MVSVCRKAKRRQNMTPRELRSWMGTEAYKDYKRYRDGQKYSGYTRNVVERAISVAKGSASKGQCSKVNSYLARAKKISSGKRKYGSGRSKVSANTAALRNWGFDPTK